MSRNFINPSSVSLNIDDVTLDDVRVFVNALAKALSVSLRERDKQVLSVLRELAPDVRWVTFPQTDGTVVALGENYVGPDEPDFNLGHTELFWINIAPVSGPDDKRLNGWVAEGIRERDEWLQERGWRVWL